MGFVPNPSITTTYEYTNKGHVLFQSTKPTSSSKKKKKKTNQKKRRGATTETSQSSANNGRTRKSKKDMASLITSIGLQPVTKPKTSSSSKKGSSPNPRSQNQSENHIQVENVSLRVQLDYARNGHAAIRSLFTEPLLLETIKTDLMAHAEQRTLEAWRQKVEVASNSPSLAQSCRTIQQCVDELVKLDIPYDLPFLQHFNTWRSVESVKNLALSPSLGRAAAKLLDVPSVRLYQDSLFCKRCGDGPTPWHTDARMTPFDTSNMITFWIPLQKVPIAKGTGLIFVSKSHSDFALPFWNDFEGGTEYGRLDERYGCSEVNHMPLELGDVTIHSGWTLHCADGNESDEDRMALAITYVDARAEIREDAMKETEGTMDGGYGDNEDKWSYKDWVTEVLPRKQFTHPLVPIVWTSTQ